MVEVQVETPGGSYPIKVGAGILGSLGAELKALLPRVTQVLVISDETVAALHGEAALGVLRDAGLNASLVTVPAGEGSKSLTELGALWERCAEAGLDRSSCIVALGGGVVGDLAGFVAATYMRGIAFIQVPTTLLAVVDSSVGGKTGIDLPQGKNLVGSFHQPILVLADIDLLATLPPREISAGLAEVVKHGIIRDPGLLNWLEQNAEAILALERAPLAELLAWNCRIKASVVGQDERESGLRAILNFGHTIGHALEAVVGGHVEAGGWVHGECVAVGTVGALVLSQAVGVLQEPSLIQRVEALLRRLRLPVRFPTDLDSATIVPFLARDKKATGGRPKWVLAERVGSVLLRSDITDDQVLKALAYLQA